MVHRKYLSILTIFVNPFLSLIFSIFVLNKENYKYFWFSVVIFFSFLAYVMNPYENMDLVRHYYFYDNYDSNSYLSADIKNFGLYIMVSILNLLGLNKQFLPFFTVFFSLSSLFFLLDEYVESLTAKELLYVTVLVLLGFSFMASANGIRNGLSTCLCVSSLFSFNSGKKLRAAVVYLSAILIHPYVIIASPLLLLSLLITRREYYYVFIILSLITSFFDISSLLSSLLSFFLPSEISNIIVDTYIYGDEWGKDAASNSDTATFIVNTFISKITFFWGLCYLIYNHSNFSIMSRFCFLLGCLVIICFQYTSVSNRYAYLFSIIFILHYISLMINFDSNCKCDILAFNRNNISLILVYLIPSAWGFYRYVYIFLDSWCLVFFKPTILLFFKVVSSNGYLSV